MIAPHHGQPYTHGERVDPGILRQILDAVRRLQVRVEWPLAIEPTTNTIYVDGDTDSTAVRYIRITGPPDATAHYPWVELVDDPATDALVPGTTTGAITDDPAIELNGSRNVGVGYNAEAWRDDRGFLRFRAARCSA